MAKSTGNIKNITVWVLHAHRGMIRITYARALELWELGSLSDAQVRNAYATAAKWVA